MEDSRENINTLFEKGMANSITDPKSSFKLGDRILEISKETNSEQGIAEAYLLKAYSGQFLGIHAQAYEFVNLALPVFIRYNDLKNQASAYNTLGFIYYYYDDHENRLEVNLKSLEIRQKIKDKDGYMRSLNNTGDTYLKMGKYKKALEHFDECLEYAKSNTRMLAVVNSNIAQTSYFMNKFHQALKFVDTSMENCLELNLTELIYYNLYIKSCIYNKLENYKGAILQLEQAVEILNDDSGGKEIELKDLYKEASIAYENLKDFINSLRCLKKHYSLEKDLQIQRQKKEIKSIQFRNEISSLRNKTNELEQIVEVRTKELEETLETERNISFFTQELNNTKTLDEVLWKLVKNCISKLNLEDCVVYLIDEKSQLLIQKAAYGPKSNEDEKITNPITIKIGNGIVGSVAKNGKYELITDTSLDDRYILDDEMRLSELAVPIFYEKKVIGVIDSEHSEKDFYTPRHVTIFKLLANIVESRIGSLKEQEAKEELQLKIIRINENLEKEVKRKSKENTELNHKILEQEKKTIIGEMSTIIAHELNSPLATIKGGNEAIIYLFNKLLNSNFLEFITPEELKFVIDKTQSNVIVRDQKKLYSKKDQEEVTELLEKNVPKDMIDLYSQANINTIEEIKFIKEFKARNSKLEFIFLSIPPTFPAQLITKSGFFLVNEETILIE